MGKLCCGAVAFALLSVGLGSVQAQNYLTGSVAGPNGPEAGVWVIAETKDLPTRFARIVVTDDEGRYLVPDLPRAEYDVWVRGYGLVDSPKVKATVIPAPAGTGMTLDLAAVPAPSDKEAAQYYPAMYWFSLMHVPDESEFPLGKMSSQSEWLHTVKQAAASRATRSARPGRARFRTCSGRAARSIRSTPGRSASPRAARARRWRATWRGSASRGSGPSRSGPMRSRRARCLSRGPSGRRAPRATSWLRSGTGASPPTTFRTSSRPTGATRA